MSSGSASPDALKIVVQNVLPREPWLGRWIFRAILVALVAANVYLYLQYRRYSAGIHASEVFREGDMSASDKIAVIPINGMITSETIQAPKRELQHAADDAAVKAVILSIDTPGGTISGSDELFHAIEKFKAKTERKKPIVAAMRGMATSGGYYVAMPADKIIAERSCMTGSIGVILSSFTAEKLMEKLGVENEVIKSGKMKDSGSPFRAMTEEERKEWKRQIMGMYEQFIEVIVKYRGKQIGGEERLREIADGRVYRAPEALDLKLIDAIGYFDDALAETKRLAGLSDRVRVIGYERPVSPWLGYILGSTPPTTPAGLGVNVNDLINLQTPQLLLMPRPVVGSF